MTVSFKSNELINTGLSLATIYGANANDTTTALIPFACSGGFCYRFSATVDNNYTNGNISFQIDLFDLVGNQHSAISTTSDSSTVNIDNQRVNIIGLDMYSDHVYSSDVAISGNIVSIFLQTEEQLRTGSLSIIIAGQT